MNHARTVARRLTGLQRPAVGYSQQEGPAAHGFYPLPWLNDFTRKVFQ